MNWDEWSHDEEEELSTERESARLRREATRFEARLEAAVWKMLEMKPDELHKIGLEEEMLDAISIGRSLKPSKARNRQVRLITKFFRQLSDESVSHIVDQIEHGSEKKAVILQYAELWRSSLLEHGDTALGALLEIAPAVDKQQVRQLCRTINKAKTSTKKERAYKDLFKLLKAASLNEAPPLF